MKSKKIIYILLITIGILWLLSLWITSIQDKPITEIEEAGFNETSLNTDKAIPNKIILDNGNGQRFNVPIASIPDLEKYLEEQIDKKVEIDRIQTEYLNWNIQDNYYFVLKYGCGNKLCNLVLVQLSKGSEINTLYLSEGILAGTKVKENKAMFRIAVNEGSSVATHQILIADLIKMKLIVPLDKTMEELYFKSPNYPITDFKWITANTILLEVADIHDGNYETLEKWYKAANAPLKNVEIIIE